MSDQETSTGTFPPCMRPPKGWVCTRDPAHEGPCAAHPVGNDIAAEQIEQLKAALRDSNLAYIRVLRERSMLNIPKIENLLLRGWALTTAAPSAGKFHATVHLGRINGPDSHHCIDKSVLIALAQLERYIGAKETK